MHGILIVDKPKGYTSRDVVNIVSHCCHTKKVGHTGTLDPLATGVMILCVGDYTKFVPMLTNHDKKYVAKLHFGYNTDTMDVTGKEISKSDKIPTKEEIESVLKKFIGRQEQEVPLYSAKKVKGKKLYEYAREGKEVELPKQKIEVYDLQLLKYDHQEAEIFCHVSKGTYIRRLLYDISMSLHTCGVMEDLRRTEVGDFDLSKAVSIFDIQTGHFSLLPFSSFLSYEVCESSLEEERAISYRNAISKASTSPYILFQKNGEDLALYHKGKHGYYPLLVFDKTSFFA